MLNDSTIEDFGLPHANIPEHPHLERCDKCCRTFRNWDHLENHRAAHRIGQVQYWCLPQCGEGYTSAAGLQQHQRLCQEILAVRYFDPTFMSPPVASSAPNHPRPTSAQTSSSSSSGSEQGTEECDGSSTKSTKRYRAKCDRCPRSFKSRAALNEHLAGHERGTLVCCPTPGCGSGYPTPREVKVHQKATGCGGPGPGHDVNEVHSSVGANPRGGAGIVKVLWTSEGRTRILQDWKKQVLEGSYRKCSGYPKEDELYRLSGEIGVAIDIVRRWFSTRRMQGL
ncbi:hypothetical protein V8D89_011750 [Ganoderma adspersum]